MLSERARQANMTEAEYLRFLVRQKPGDCKEVRELTQQLIREVGRVGVNINQIVHHHNYALYSEQDRRMLTAYLQKIDRTLREAVDRIGNQQNPPHEG